MTNFFPQSRMLCRKVRSLSESGRSEEVTNKTRSDRGMNLLVMVSCSRIIALVPGVSTMLISFKIVTGAFIKEYLHPERFLFFVRHSG